MDGMPDLLRLGLLDRLLMLPERLPRPAQEQIRISHTDMRIISEKFEVQTRAKTSLFCLDDSYICFDAVGT